MDRARRAQPSANPIITRQWNMHCMKMHKAKLSKVKASIDNRPPKPMRHLRRNLKREQMREERYSAIERENRILLQKMASILRSNKTMDTINSYKSRSLNRESRRRELIRITHENQGILRRIQASEPTYNHIAWEEDRRLMERRRDNISLYDRHGREKVLTQIKSRQRLAAARASGGGRNRPQSAPTYQVRNAQRASGGRRARPASAMRSRGDVTYTGASYDTYDDSGAGYEQVLAGRQRARPASAAEGAGRPRGAYRPASAGRTRGRGRPASAARTRPGGRPGYSGRSSALDDPELMAGAVLGGDDDAEAVIIGGGEGDGVYDDEEYKY